MARLDSRGWGVAAVTTAALLLKVAVFEGSPLLALACSPHLVLLTSLFMLARAPAAGGWYRRWRQLLGAAGALSVALFSRGMRECPLLGRAPPAGME